MTDTIMCCDPECTEPATIKARALCNRHYKKFRSANPTAPKLTGRGLSVEECFIRRINKTPEHWLWTGKINKRGKGYGDFTFKVDGRPKTVPAHRFAWQLWVGPIPPGLHLDHVAERCQITWCVWPEHLEPVTLQENTRRFYALQTHCKWGHLFDEENTKIDVTPEGFIHRICRACGRRRNRDHYHRNRLPS